MLLQCLVVLYPCVKNAQFYTPSASYPDTHNIDQVPVSASATESFVTADLPGLSVQQTRIEGEFMPEGFRRYADLLEAVEGRGMSRACWGGLRTDRH